MRAYEIPLESVANELLHVHHSIKRQQQKTSANTALAVSNFAKKMSALAALMAVANDDDINVSDSNSILLPIYMAASNTPEYSAQWNRNQKDAPTFIVHNNKRIMQFEWD